MKIPTTSYIGLIVALVSVSASNHSIILEGQYNMPEGLPMPLLRMNWIAASVGVVTLLLLLRIESTRK